MQTYAVTDAVQKVCESYKCKPIEGMLSHQLKQFKIVGEKTIIQNPNDAQKKEHEKFEFATHEVYAMDVLVSTGEGVVSFAFRSNAACGRFRSSQDMKLCLWELIAK